MPRFAVIGVLILFLHSAHSTYCTSQHSQHSQHSLPSRHSTVLSQRSGASLPLQPHTNSHTICPLLTSNPSCESFFYCPAASPAAISPPLPSTPSPSFPLSLLPSRQTLILPTNPVNPAPSDNSQHANTHLRILPLPLGLGYLIVALCAICRRHPQAPSLLPSTSASTSPTQGCHLDSQLRVVDHCSPRALRPIVLRHFYLKWPLHETPAQKTRPDGGRADNGTAVISWFLITSAGHSGSGAC